MFAPLNNRKIREINQALRMKTHADLRTRSNLAANLKIERKKQGLSQQSLAEKAKLSVGTVSKLEIAAVENPTLETIAVLGFALQLDDSLKLLKN